MQAGYAKAIEEDVTLPFAAAGETILVHLVDSSVGAQQVSSGTHSLVAGVQALPP